MELIFEIIIELFFEGTLAFAKGKYPLWLKIPAIVIVSVVYISIIVLIGFVGISSISEGNFIGGTVILIIDILITVFVLKKLFKSKK
ncbi:MAG: hypothetical protein K2J47_05410 [Ruminococcus sp.]|nr:hypothetical protein [Ruminococcus sp.]